MHVTQLLIAKIRTDGGTQQRERTREDVVDDMAEALHAGVVFPPIVVYRNAELLLWLASGFHRLGAHVKVGRKYIDAEIRSGSLRDAVLYSVGCNHLHGLHRTPGDKRKALGTLLGDPEWAKWNNSEIARRCGVSQALARAMRLELSSRETMMRPALVLRAGTTYSMQPRGRKALAGLPADRQAALVVAADEAALRPQALIAARRHLTAAAQILTPYADQVLVCQAIALALGRLGPAVAA